MTNPPTPSATLHGLTLGPLELWVGNMSRSVQFYQTILGLNVRQQGADYTVLGTTERDLVALYQSRPAPRTRATGLYHFALLLPSRADLGAFLAHLLAMGVQPGAGDHLVSEALYLNDPEGNGIEVYADRPRSQWTYSGGQIKMTTDPVAGDKLLALAQSHPWQGIPADTVMGHFHLKVADQQQATHFYSLVGLDVMAALPGASFMAADGYHHHLGLNSWESRGAAPAAAGTPGLRALNWHITPPQLQSLAQRLEAAPWPFEQSANALLITDPSGNTSRFIGYPDTQTARPAAPGA